MTEKAQKIVDATMELTLRPQQGDRAKVIAAAIRAIVSDYESWEDGTYMVKSNDILEIADELEALK
jgi:hypothetical protein